MKLIAFDRLELPALFDLQLVEALSRPALGDYAYQYTRPDCISILLSMRTHTGQIMLTTRTETIVISSLSLTQCTDIRVLDTKRRQFELLFEPELGLRIFVDLLGSSILSLGARDR